MDTEKMEHNILIAILAVIIALVLVAGILSFFALAIMFALQNIVSLYTGVQFNGFLFSWQAFLSIIFFIVLIDTWGSKNIVEIQKKMTQVQLALQEQIETYFNEIEIKNQSKKIETDQQMNNK